MGKRKERRLAALSNAGRRVKLDLVPEPSGDLGGSSGNGEVQGDIDPTQRTGFPNSPSSSGQQPQNPLLLLGQYSDDELDEEPNRREKHANAETSSSDHDAQDGRLGEGKEVDTSAVEDTTSQKGELLDVERDSTPSDVFQMQSLEDGDPGETDSAASNDKGKEFDSSKQVSVTGISNERENGDVGSGWRIVMHEETGQCYYWNTETGETSWEIPEILTQTTQSLTHQVVPLAENMVATPLDANHPSSTLGIGLDSSSAALVEGCSVGASMITQSEEVHVNGSQMKEWVEGFRSDFVKDKNSVADVYQSEFQSNMTVANVLSSGEVTNDEIENGMDLPTNLMRRCECLLERIKSLKGYGNRLQCQEQMSKYIIEVEVRFSDIKSLSSYASLLVPFWIHSQEKLKELEVVINSEIYQLAVSAQMDDADATTNDPNKKENSCDMGRDSGADGCEDDSKSELPNCTTAVENDLQKDDLNENVKSRDVSSFGLSNEHLDGGASALEKANGTTYSESDFLPGEDVDMDVDMEVDDGVSTSITNMDVSSMNTFSSVKQPSHPSTPAEHATSVSGDESIIPPPPEEDWIPPPPPDSDQVPPLPPENEQVPPPPPDEPSESSYHPLPSYVETGQPLTYTEYNLSYHDSSFQYYGSTFTVPSNNLYGHAEGSQVPVPHASLYYGAVPNTYAETAPVIVNPVDPVAYYNIEDGAVAHVPVSITESSHIHSGSHSVAYSNLASGQTRTGDDPIEVPRKLKIEISATSGETAIESAGVASTSTNETPATSIAKENISAPLTSAVTVPVAVPTTTTAPKVQTKVSRAKKRPVAVASSLRSHKKVSSLVDKWKAAKEELNEIEEDEAENPYEILEKKRQREIEEWHAKQIASGEAKDNANFQPLGGDWRERVKRRRAQMAKEAALASPGAPNMENQQPGLAELSKELPSGWQAYWDEASKQVYYGNLRTSETTWSKPTK